MKKITSITLLVLTALLVITACSRTKVESRLIDRQYQVYEIAIQSYGDCDGLWQGSDICVANLRPQIHGTASSICGKPPVSIHSCAEREVDDGRQVFCTVECDERPDVDETALERAGRCQSEGGIWINDRCEIGVR